MRTALAQPRWTSHRHTTLAAGVDSCPGPVEAMSHRSDPKVEVPNPPQTT